MVDAPPFSTLTHYRLLELLGRGAMGEIWLAEDLQLPRRVAIKLLPRHLSRDPEAVERLLREARAAATIDHPNVVTVYEAGTADGHPYLVMQRVEGETLEERLARGPLPVPEALAMVRAIADALAEVHALGIVHRDLKPLNIMLTPRGPKVLDFGIAALKDHGGMATEGEMVGTPLYMSPEQVQGLPPDNRSDLWSLGVILYQALTGARAFDGANLPAIARAVRETRPAPASQRNAAVPAELDHIVEKLLRKDPAQRYGRAEDLIADLDNCAECARGADGIDTAALAAFSASPIEANDTVVVAPRTAPRLGVLYFESLSTDPDDVILAEGLTEDLIVDLARVEGLRVAARGEVQRFRGRELPPRTVARELNVDYVVQGSVRRAGQRARISAQLVRASDGHASWAERFDRTLDDLFQVQAEVSKRIVEALQVTLRPAERAMLDRAPARSREAYSFYLRARGLMDDRRREANFRAEECLRRAIELDPQFALAHATLGECLAFRAASGWAGREITEAIKPHIQRALELDPELPLAHIAMGLVYRLEGDPEGVLRSIQRATGPDTTDPNVIIWTGWSYMALGKPELAIEILERGQRLHPRNYMLLSGLADCYVMLGRREDEKRTLDRIREVLVETLERTPDNADARAILSICLAQMGDKEAGIAQAKRALEIAPGEGRVHYNVACTYVYAGMPDEALAQLRRMMTVAPGFLTDWIRRDPDLVSLHGRPEWKQLFGEEPAAN
jgi:TolB-like protein/Flp pilus assembly protein TadD